MSPKNTKAKPVSPDRLTNVTELLRETADAHTFLNQGNKFHPPLDNADLVARMLVLANKNSTIAEIADAMYTTELSHELPSTFAGNMEILQDKGFQQRVLDFWNRTTDGRNVFKQHLVAITSKNKKAIRALNSELDELISHIVIVPSLSWNGKSLAREDYFHSLSLAGTLAYVLMLLLDPNRGLTSKLRQCKFEKCQRFFLSRSSGGRPPLYCSRDCKSINDALSSAERTRKWRENKTNKGERS